MQKNLREAVFLAVLEAVKTITLHSELQRVTATSFCSYQNGEGLEGQS
jgi:hypothetical protein